MLVYLFSDLRLELFNEFVRLNIFVIAYLKNISLNIYGQTDRIKKVYFDPSGCVSIQKNTLSGAKQNDSTMKLDDVKYVLPSM